MSMSTFIRSHLDAIALEFEAFASRQEPAARPLTPRQLRDSVEGLLTAIAADLENTPARAKREGKSADRPS